MAMDLNAKAAYIRGLMTGMEFEIILLSLIQSQGIIKKCAFAV